MLENNEIWGSAWFAQIVQLDSDTSSIEKPFEKTNWNRNGTETVSWLSMNDNKGI